MSRPYLSIDSYHLPIKTNISPIAPHPYVYPDDSHGTIDSMPKNQNTGFCSFRRFSLSYILPCACRIGYTTDELRNLYPPIQFYCIYTAACNNTL